MPKAFYRKGNMYGRSGYHIAIGFTDYRFYFGTLEQAKTAACARFCTKPQNMEWIRMEE